METIVLSFSICFLYAAKNESPFLIIPYQNSSDRLYFWSNSVHVAECNSLCIIFYAHEYPRPNQSVTTTFLNDQMFRINEPRSERTGLRGF